MDQPRPFLQGCPSIIKSKMENILTGFFSKRKQRANSASHGKKESVAGRDLQGLFNRWLLPFFSKGFASLNQSQTGQEDRRETGIFFPFTRQTWHGL